MEYKTLYLAHDAGIATITLNRPDKRNAISYELIENLLAALDEVANSSALVLVLTGAGKAFCSGMDLEDLKALVGRSPEQSLKDSEIMARVFRTLYDFPRPTIAAVNGAAIAGGCGLATLCDFTLAVCRRMRRFVPRAIFMRASPHFSKSANHAGPANEQRK
jgi:methylglutaconyl-CoA hydratase